MKYLLSILCLFVLSCDSTPDLVETCGIDEFDCKDDGTECIPIWWECDDWCDCIDCEDESSGWPSYCD